MCTYALVFCAHGKEKEAVGWLLEVGIDIPRQFCKKGILYYFLLIILDIDPENNHLKSFAVYKRESVLLDDHVNNMKM